MKSNSNLSGKELKIASGTHADDPRLENLETTLKELSKSLSNVETKLDEYPDSYKQQGYFVRGQSELVNKYTTTTEKTLENIYPRADKHIKSGELLIADIDDTDLSPFKAHKKLKKLNVSHIIYTSFNHNKEAPRYRIVIPCALVKEYLKPTIANLSEELGIEIDDCSNTWCQRWYYGYSKFPGQFKHYEFLEGEKYLAVSSHANKDGETVVNEPSSDRKENRDTIGKGEHFYEQSRSLAQGYANEERNKILGTTTTEEEVFEIILGRLRKDALKNNCILDSYKHIENVHTHIRGAIKKVEQEGKKKPTIKISKTKRKSMPVIPDELIFPDDEYGELIRNVMESTPHRSNPVAAMVHGNSVVAFAADGYATSGESITSGIRIVLGETRCGKTLTVQSARGFMPADSIERILTQLASGQGLEDALAEFEKRPSVFIALDEIGAVLKSIKNSKSESSMMGRLLEIVTNGLGVMTTRPLAQQKRKILYAPRLVVSGNTTIEMSKGAITRADIETGATNRMTFFSANQNVKVKRIGDTVKRNPKFTNRIKEIFNHGNIEGFGRCSDYREVVITKEVAEWIFKHEEKAVKEGGSNLRGRHCELAVSWAIPRAVFVAYKKPVIDMNIFMWAYEIIELSMQTIEYLFEVHFGSDNEYAEAEKKLVERLENNGGEMTKRDAMNFRPCIGWDEGMRKRLLKNLDEVVEVEEVVKASGKTSFVMRLIGRLG